MSRCFGVTGDLPSLEGVFCRVVSVGGVSKGQIARLPNSISEHLISVVCKSTGLGRMHASGCEPDSTKQSHRCLLSVSALSARNPSTDGFLGQPSDMGTQNTNPTQQELESEILWLRNQLEKAMQERNEYQARAKELFYALRRISYKHPALAKKKKDERRN